MKIQHHKTHPIKKALLVSAIVVTCSASANTPVNGSCNVELEAGLTIDVKSIEFFSESTQKTLYTIDNDKTLIVADKKVDLNSHQQRLITEYSSHIKAMVPKINAIAIEGVDIAVEGVNIAFNDLLGENNIVSADLTRELLSIRDEVTQRFTLENGLTLGEKGLKNKELLGEDFEQRIETAVEKTIMNSMGAIMMALGKEIMASGGDSKSFETRMGDFTQNIEHEMDVRTEKIERKVNKLCSSIIKIDQLEEQLRQSIAPLADINVISASYTQPKAHSEKRAM